MCLTMTKLGTISEMKRTEMPFKILGLSFQTPVSTQLLHVFLICCVEVWIEFLHKFLRDYYLFRFIMRQSQYHQPALFLSKAAFWPWSSLGFHFLLGEQERSAWLEIRFLQIQISVKQLPLKFKLFPRTRLYLGSYQGTWLCSPELTCQSLVKLASAST